MNYAQQVSTQRREKYERDEKIQPQLEELKKLSPSALAKAANKCKPRNAPINQHTIRFEDGPFAGFEWKYSIGCDFYKTNVALTLELEVNGQRGYYEYRHIKPFATAVMFVTTHQQQR